MKPHIGTIDIDFLDSEYQATCSCGWCGNVWDKQEAADLEMRNHYYSVTLESATSSEWKGEEE